MPRRAFHGVFASAASELACGGEGTGLGPRATGVPGNQRVIRGCDERLFSRAGRYG